LTAIAGATLQVAVPASDRLRDAAPTSGVAPTGNDPCGRCLCPTGCLPTGDRLPTAGRGQLPPLTGIELQPATLERLPYGLAAGGGQPGATPCGLSLAAASRPFAGGLGHNTPPL
ncbi:hypothetical protein B296_00058512, partial [Ensete ventricosum]